MLSMGRKGNGLLDHGIISELPDVEAAVEMDAVVFLLHARGRGKDSLPTDMNTG